MSVINKMLRDLDSRQGVEAAVTATPLRRRGAGGAVGTRAVDDWNGSAHGHGSRRFAIRVATLTLAAGAIVATWWYVTRSAAVPNPAESPRVASTATLPTLAVSPIVPVSATVPARSAPVAAVHVETESPVGASLKMEARLRRTPIVPVPDKVQVQPAAPVDPGRAASSIVRAPHAVANVASGVAVAQPATSRRSATVEVLAQAQNLWGAGSRGAATDLLRDALAAIERSGQLNHKLPDDGAVIGSLVRELAQMELAQGNASQTLEMLTRLTPALSGNAELWAIRGNAAQRLGRHADSAAAYLMALKLRPDEPRWMLGAAVSLAAQGQTAAATEQAEAARARGALTPELATYLRQLGVTLRER